jgi:hypothetical protein
VRQELQEASSKGIFESLDDHLCCYDKCFEGLTQLVPSNTGNFIDRYVNVQLAVHVNLDCRREFNNSESGQFAFVIQKIAGDAFEEEKAGGRVETDVSRHFSERSGYDMQTSMPILSGTIIQKSKDCVDARDRSVVCFNSVIRLYVLNPVPKLIREWCEVRSTFFKLGSFGANRKEQLILIGGRIGASDLDHGLIDGTIKGRSELIEKFSQFQSDVAFGATQSNGLEDSCPIALYLTLDSVGVIFDQSIPMFVERFAVNGRPPDSVPALLK